MSITRRLFARALPALPVAMKAAVSAGVSGPLADIGPAVQSAEAGWASLASGMTSFDRAGNLRKQIAELIGGRQERLASYMRDVRRLDADLASMRSLSLSARIRLQAQRNEAADFERQHGWLQQQLLDHLGGKLV